MNRTKRDGTLYCCAYENCSAKFSRSYKLQCHQRLHTGERPYVCDFEDCGKSYTRPAHLTRHQESHSKPFRCKVEGCSEVLKTKASLQKHLDCFHKQKKHKTYKCSICDEEFNKHNWLQSHMYRHTGEIPHTCPEEGCGRGFLLPSRLKRHMKYHHSYPCGTGSCDLVFKHWSLLVKHKKECHPVVHPCDDCGKVFSTSSSLKKHSQVHKTGGKVFACEFPNCTRFYTQKKNLTHHVKYFHNRRPFNCTWEHCHRAFKTEDERTKHHLRHHSKKPIKKKKKSPPLAAKLAGCVIPKTINQDPEKESTANEESEPKVEAAVKDKANNPADYVTVTVSISEMKEPENPKSCLAIFEGILNGSFLPSETESS